MGRNSKSVAQMTMKMSKDDIQARQEAEAMVVTNQTKPKASPMLKKEEKKIFNKLKKRNDNFTEGDSDSLNLLAQYLHRWYQLKELLDSLNPLDDQAGSLERRMIGIDKQINQHMTALCMPLSQRLRLANDMAKITVEERKLEQMESQQKQEINPVYAVLEATKNVK